MRKTPLTTEQQRHAVQHAINTMETHFLDTDREEDYNTLQTAKPEIQDNHVIPANAVALVWEILMEHDHVKIASAPDYNDGVDRKPLIDVLYNLVASNGDELYQQYASYRDQHSPTDSVSYEIEGASVLVPDSVMVIEDADDAPKRLVESKLADYSDEEIPRFEDSAEYHIVPGGAAYAGQRPFACASYWEDATSSSWYAEVYETPGASEDIHQQAADETDAVTKAIALAEKYDIPLLLEPLYFGY